MIDYIIAYYITIAAIVFVFCAKLLFEEVRVGRYSWSRWFAMVLSFSVLWIVWVFVWILEWAEKHGLVDDHDDIEL